MKTIHTTLFLLFLTIAGYSQTYFISFINADDSKLPGDSENTVFIKTNGWSEMNSLSLNVFTPVVIGKGSASSASFTGIPQTGMIEFTKPYFAPLSTKLSDALVKGIHFKKIIIVGNRQNGVGALVPFVRYEFEIAFMGNITRGFSNSTDGLTNEKYLFKAGKFSIFNYNYANPDGTGAVTCKSYGWDFTTIKEINTSTTCPAPGAN